MKNGMFFISSFWLVFTESRTLEVVSDGDWFSCGRPGYTLNMAVI
jgi:hypothetical protein